VSAPGALPWRPHAAWFARTYGVAEKLFAEHAFWAVPGDPRVWMATAHSAAPADADALANIGWPVLDAPLPDGAATPAALVLIGADATRNVVDVAAPPGDTLPAPAGADAALLVVRMGKRVLGGLRRDTGRFESGPPGL
jgi:hypothetical protein